MSAALQPEVRTVQASINDAHATLSQAEEILAALYNEVTGYAFGEDAKSGPASIGLVNDADRLASRLVALTNLLDMTRNRILAKNVESISPYQNSPAAQMNAVKAGWSG